VLLRACGYSTFTGAGKFTRAHAELDRLPACYFVCERNSVVRIRT
jgi:hypothetical protein